MKEISCFSDLFIIEKKRDYFIAFFFNVYKKYFHFSSISINFDSYF